MYHGPRPILVLSAQKTNQFGVCITRYGRATTQVCTIQILCFKKFGILPHVQFCRGPMNP